MSSQDLGLFCVSVDSVDADTLSTEVVRRRRELIALLEQFQVPSNWTIQGKARVELPKDAELTVGVPKGLERGELIQYLRQMSALLLRDRAALNSVVVDPHEARSPLGCARSARLRCRSTTHGRSDCSNTGARILRGGLWIAPLSCSFVGGSRRSVRSLFGVCQRRLVESAARRQLFHLNINVGRSRDSWTEERDALRALLETASDQRRKGRLSCARLSELPNILTKKSTKPMLSILKAA